MLNVYKIQLYYINGSNRAYLDFGYIYTHYNIIYCVILYIILDIRNQ